ncbi:MAG: hypothetical protein Q9227_002968 [Pyrenula ochraceoflavens]
MDDFNDDKDIGLTTWTPERIEKLRFSGVEEKDIERTLNPSRQLASIFGSGHGHATEEDREEKEGWIRWAVGKAKCSKKEDVEEANEEGNTKGEDGVDAEEGGKLVMAVEIRNRGILGGYSALGSFHREEKVKRDGILALKEKN